MIDSDLNYLKKQRIIWEHKPVLQRLYNEQFYSRLLTHCAAGKQILEIGSGSGFLRSFAPSVWRTDILVAPWLHATIDAHHLPFADGALDNVIGLDVLHHFNKPMSVLQEIQRVLRVRGRLVLVEPWITPFSRFVYNRIHQEICDFNAAPWEEDQDQFGDQKKAFDGNPAIPYLLLEQGSDTLKRELPAMGLCAFERFSLFSYLLTFGFRTITLLPEVAYPIVYSFERTTQPLWENVAALRALIVWEKR